MDQPTTIAEQPPTPLDLHARPAPATVHPLRPTADPADVESATTITDDVDDILAALGMPGPGEADAGVAVQVQQLPTARQRHLFRQMMTWAAAYAVPPSGPRSHGQTITVRFRHRSELKVTFLAAAVADYDERSTWAIDKDLLR